MQTSMVFDLNPDGLKKSLRRPNRFDTVKEIQAIVNQFEDAAKASGNPVSCAKGCSYCCKSSKIMITGTEADIISKHVDREVQSSYGVRKNFKGIACAFLSQVGECMIYDARPATCRAAISFDDPIKCRDEISRDAFSTDHVYRELIAIFTKQEWKDVTKRLGCDMDIREAFPPSS